MAISTQVVVAGLSNWIALVAVPVVALAAYLVFRAVRRRGPKLRGEVMAGPVDALWAAARTLVVRSRVLVSVAWLIVLLVVAVSGDGIGGLQVLAAVLVLISAVIAATAAGFAVRSVRRGQQHLAAARALGDGDGEIDLTIVIPYFNPGPLLRRNLDALIAVLDRGDITFEIVPVSDGSTDGSDRTIADYPDERVRPLTLAVNQGKGAALLAGLTSGRGSWLGFIDADGDLDPEHLRTFMALIKLYRPDVVMGSKRHPLSEVDYPPIRRVYSVGYQLMTRMLFALNLRDTQTGVKLVRRDVLAAALPRLMEKRFAFDLELLVVSRRLGYKRVLEAPVVIRQQFTSTISVRAVRQTLLDTLAIYYRAEILRYYDGPVGQPLPARASSPPVAATGAGHEAPR